MIVGKKPYNKYGNSNMLESIHIKNFRCFEDLTIPSLGRVNLIVGKNNSGKSTLLDAIFLHANRGNIWAIQRILSGRNEFPQIDTNQTSSFLSPQSTNQARIAFDSLINIFSKKIYNGTCSINTVGYSKKTTNLQLERTNDLESTKKTHGIPPITNSYTSELPQREFTQEGFLVTFRSDKPNCYIASTPYTIINDISQITPPIPIIANSIIVTYIYDEPSLANIWSHLQDFGEDIHINNAIKIIEPRISRAYYTVDTKIAKVQIQGNGAQTMKSMGDGVSRIFQLFILTYAAKGGVLIIDEFENGLHYSIQEEVWKKIFELAKELDIQVFATTHSQDTIRTFSKVALLSEEEGRLISLGRNEREIDKGKITALTYNEDDIKLIAETGMEVR